MSDRLAFSATLSVLMMTIYVLFGADASRMPLGPEQLRVPAAATAPGMLGNPGRLFIFRD
jgi:hypothetical protein